MWKNEPHCLKVPCCTAHNACTVSKPVQKVHNISLGTSTIPSQVPSSSVAGCSGHASRFRRRSCGPSGIMALVLSPPCQSVTELTGNVSQPLVTTLAKNRKVVHYATSDVRQTGGFSDIRYSCSLKHPLPTNMQLSSGAMRFVQFMSLQSVKGLQLHNRSFECIFPTSARQGSMAVDS